MTHALLRDLLPAAGAARRYGLVVLISSIGTGLYISGTVVFATRVVGLTPQQLGLALSASGVAGAVAAATMGGLADRFGARRMMRLLCLLEGIGYLLYTIVDTFPAFTALACFVAVVGFGKMPASAALVSASAAGQGRVRLRAQSRSLLNLGFSLGAALSALALTIGTMPAYYALPIGNAVTFFVGAILVRGLPEVTPVATSVERRPFTALRSVPVLTTTALTGILAVHGSLVLVIVPLWIVERTSAPHALIGLLLVANTVLCVLFQVRASAGAETLAGSVRKARWSAAALVLGCVVIGFSAGAPAAVAVAVVAAGYVFFTVGEMLQSASQWGMAYALAPEHVQAEYHGAFGMSLAVDDIVGPTVGTWAVLTLGLLGWWAIGAAFVLAAIALGPAARWTARTLARLHGPAPESQVPRPDDVRQAA
ncbi:MFS transporter [Actinokineospora sp.]|uniref:MFS transporter n=1 Tax=Actinokineospora sp. TaxID=1872133 RepID=UPI004037DDC6